MYRQNTKNDTNHADYKQFGHREILSSTIEAQDYPIIENQTTALLFPEEIKGGIDLSDNDNDNDNVTAVPKEPYTPLRSQNILNEKYISQL